MDYERIKRDANDILEDLSSECSYIEYKASASQLAKILKTKRMCDDLHIIHAVEGIGKGKYVFRK